MQKLVVENLPVLILDLILKDQKQQIQDSILLERLAIEREVSFIF